jgi:ribosomal protein L37E
MSWKEPKVEPSPGSFPVSGAEIKRPGPDLKELYLAVSSRANHHFQNIDVTSSPISAILVKSETGESQPGSRSTSLDRKLPLSLTSMPSVQLASVPCDSSVLALAPPLPRPQDLTYPAPALVTVKRELVTSSTTANRESQSLMPPPPLPRDLSRKPSQPPVNLESQLMPPPKVIPCDMRASKLEAAPASALRTSSGFPGAGGPGHDKEDIEFDNNDHVLCRVCGDKASGFHYGVHSCEGCKVGTTIPALRAVNGTCAQAP